MAAANASARGQRAAIFASPLHELTGFYLAVDCLAPRCNGERTLPWSSLRPSTDGCLRRPRRGSLAGDRADPQCTRQTPTRAALGTGSAGIGGRRASEGDASEREGRPRDDCLR